MKIKKKFFLKNDLSSKKTKMYYILYLNWSLLLLFDQKKCTTNVLHQAKNVLQFSKNVLQIEKMYYTFIIYFIYIFIIINLNKDVL